MVSATGSSALLRLYCCWRLVDLMVLLVHLIVLLLSRSPSLAQLLPLCCCSTLPLAAHLMACCVIAPSAAACCMAAVRLLCCMAGSAAVSGCYSVAPRSPDFTAASGSDLKKTTAHCELPPIKRYCKSSLPHAIVPRELLKLLPRKLPLLKLPLLKQLNSYRK